MSEDQLHSNLLGQGKRGAQSYQKKVQQIETQIQIIKNKNNMMQKQSDNDIDDNDIKKQIYQQSQFVQVEINKIKKLLQDFSKQFKDPTSKNKLKQMWKSASKQIQRNKIIVERIVNDAPLQSFLNKDDRYRSSLLQGRGGRNSKKYNNNRRQRDSEDMFKENKNQAVTTATKQTTQQAYDDSQLYFQNQIQREKNQLLNHLQKKNLKINQVMNEIAILVDQQGENINLVTDNMNQAHQNAVITNEQLEGAITQQKKARRKYCIITVLIIIALLIVGGVVFITQTSSNDPKQ